MNSLQACLELDFSKINFLERKQRITHPKTIIIGPPKCGKSYLIYDYLTNFKVAEYLYIDLDDFKNSKYETVDDLDIFIKKNHIKALVIENYKFDFDLPKCDSIIITTNLNNKLYGFKELFLMPLDFEEYLLHDQRHQNEINSFNYFLKYGNLPGVITIDEHKKEKRLQEVIKIFTQNETQIEVIKALFLNVDEKKSLNQLYLSLKKNIKISKDKFYSLCKEYEENKLVFFIEKYNQKKATKKIYSYNHAFLTAFTHTKKFKNQFANMVFLELISKHQKIYYLDYIDFYLKDEKTIILAHPFFNSMLMNSMIKKVFNTISSLDIKKLYIITIGNNDSFYFDDIEIQVLPFYEWSLG